MNWQAFEAAAPELAAVASRLLGEPRVVLVGTVRRDGTPRISPVEPFWLGGELYLGMMPGSMKALDLLRDPRCLVHNAVTDHEGREGELKLRGRAVVVDDAEAIEAYCAELEAAYGWRPDGPFPLFTVDIEDVAWVHRESGEQKVERWVAGPAA